MKFEQIKQNSLENKTTQEFFEVPKNEIKTPSDFRERMKFFVHIGLFATTLAYSQMSNAQESPVQIKEEKDFIPQHEYTIEEVQDFQKFSKFLDMEPDSEFVKWKRTSINNSEQNLKLLRKGILALDSLINLSRDKGSEDEMVFLEKKLKLQLDMYKSTKDLYLLIQDYPKDAYYRAVQEKFIKKFAEYEKQRQWLVSTMESLAYKERFKGELGSIWNDKAKEMKLAQRKNRLNEPNDFTITKNSTVNEENLADYTPSTGKVRLPLYNTPETITSGIHEFDHKSNLGGVDLTPYARTLYATAFTDENLYDYERVYINKMFGGDRVSYLKNFTELDARKKVLEEDMERLGVKKYEEEFTQEHYKKLLELQKEGKLQINSGEFLRLIKPEYFLMIMNTIAKYDPTKDEAVSNMG